MRIRGIGSGRERTRNISEMEGGSVTQALSQAMLWETALFTLCVSHTHTRTHTLHLLSPFSIVPRYMCLGITTWNWVIYLQSPATWVSFLKIRWGTKRTPVEIPAWTGVGPQRTSWQWWLHWARGWLAWPPIGDSCPLCLWAALIGLRWSN